MVGLSSSSHTVEQLRVLRHVLSPELPPLPADAGMMPVRPLDQRRTRGDTGQRVATLGLLTFFIGIIAWGLIHGQRGYSPPKSKKTLHKAAPSHELPHTTAPPAAAAATETLDIVITADHHDADARLEFDVRLVRTVQDGDYVQYEGEKGAERRVRMVCANGIVVHYEGEKGAERLVRVVRANGDVGHFEGAQGAERLVRVVRADGDVEHYEGEKGAERYAGAL